MSVLEAEKAGSIAFFTLTYDDGNCPMMCSVVCDGEIVEQYLYDYKTCAPQRFYDEVHYSLCRKHVQAWLKRYREDYSRRHDGKRVDLRYSFFGEYGERTQRPHYHMLVYGLEKSECERLRLSWQFGFSDMRFLSHFNSDGSDAFAKVSRYVSKYISKGDFLPDFVKAGYAEKPRMQSSVRLGVRDFNVDEYRDFILPEMRLIACADVIN